MNDPTRNDCITADIGKALSSVIFIAAAVCRLAAAGAVQDGRWHGMKHATEWADSVRTNAALPTAWMYFTNQFRPYVKRYLGVPAAGPFAAELDSLADATALAIWHDEPMVSVHDTYGLHGVMLSADALCARGCTNRLARAFAAAVRYYDKLVRENRMLAEDPLARDCESLAKELVSSPEMPVAARIFSIYYGRGGCREFSEQTMVESMRSRPDELRPFFHVFGVPPAARKDGVDPWLRLVADAWGERAAAWSARGSGLAYTVGEKQWKDFGERLDKAEGYMAEAWRLHPEIPDTAAMMLKIVAPRCSKAQLNRWFAEVLDREVDNPFAWSTYFFHTLPRWGGSIKKMRRQSDVLWRTQRFDTALPYYGAIRLDWIESEHEIARSAHIPYWEVPELRERYLKSNESVVSATNCTGETASLARALVVQTYWRTGEWEMAVDKKKELIDGAAAIFQAAARNRDEPFKTLLDALSGPHQQQMMAMERYFRANKIGERPASDEVIGRARQLVEPLTSVMSELSPAERSLVGQRRAQVGDGLGYEWRNLPVASGAPGWRIVSCGPSGDPFLKNAYVAQKANFDLIWESLLPPDYEVEVEADLDASLTLVMDWRIFQPPPGVSHGCGMPAVTFLMTGKDEMEVTCHGCYNRMADAESEGRIKKIRSKRGRHVMRVRTIGRVLSVWVDDEQVFQNSNCIEVHLLGNRPGCKFSIRGALCRVYRISCRRARP